MSIFDVIQYPMESSIEDWWWSLPLKFKKKWRGSDEYSAFSTAKFLDDIERKEYLRRKLPQLILNWNEEDELMYGDDNEHL
jgi:hypothetical protein